MGPWEGFSGVNSGYVLELYERFRKDPSSVDPASRAIFEEWTPPQEPAAPSSAADGVPLQVAVGAVNLGPVDPPLRPSRRAARSARQPSARRSVVAAHYARRH